MVNVFTEAAQRLPEPAGRARMDEAARFHRLLIEECDALFETWHQLLRREQEPDASAVRLAAGA
jgi:hypothetical protein